MPLLAFLKSATCSLAAVLHPCRLPDAAARATSDGRAASDPERQRGPLPRRARGDRARRRRVQADVTFLAHDIPHTADMAIVIAAKVAAASLVGLEGMSTEDFDRL